MNNAAATATISRLAAAPQLAMSTPKVGTAGTTTLEHPVGAVFASPKECWVLPSNHHPLMVPRLGTREIPSEEEEEDDDEEDEEEISDGESCGTVSDYSTEEIPVWIKGEQRFISGVTEETTCADLIEALIQQENLAASEVKGTSAEPKEYCITERWRQVEQILDSKTKIWQIWSAWGKAQPEVKFILRRLDGSHGLALASTSSSSGTAPIGLKAAGTERDKDSGRGSPTGSINSAIVRRKRHRAHKSSFAWMTHGTTIHPKSSKNSIERLMKLILEQGDIIQQQLTKLRDRELQISKIEEDRHRLREREHGKNYLLETYFKGLSEAGTETGTPDKEDDDAAGGADSGITSEATTAASPEVESCRDVESPPGTSSSEGGGLKEQIAMLEKIVQLNKQIVKEEETAVKLYDRIRRYEFDIPNQSPEQVKENLSKVNANLEKSRSELMEVDESLTQAEIALREKNLILKRLEEELEEEELQANVIMDFSQPNPVLSIGRIGPPAEAAAPQHDPYPLPAHHPSYPLYTINEHQQQQQQHGTLPRIQRFPMTPQSVPIASAPPITVHQINKFIQSNSNLGNNCSAMLDDKTCPKKLFNSALFEGGLAKPPDDDLACMGTLV